MAFLVSKWKRRNSYGVTVILFLMGIFIGFVITNLLRKLIMYENACPYIMGNSEYSDAQFETAVDSFAVKRLLMIGILVPLSELTRAEAIFNTWGRNKAQDILFFTEKAPHSKTELPVIFLHSLDMKSRESPRNYFEVYTYFYKHYLNSFDYFMVVQLDSYVMVERLEKALWLATEQANLKILKADNLFPKQSFVCINGPQSLISSSILKLGYPHFGKCQHSFRIFSLFGNVDIGQCIRESLNIECIQQNDLSDVFRKTSIKDFTLIELSTASMFREAFVVFPIPDARSMYHTHKYVQALSLKTKELLIVQAQREAKGIVLNFGSKDTSTEHVSRLDDPAQGVFIDHMGHTTDLRKKLRACDFLSNETHPNQTGNVWYFASKDKRVVYHEREEGVTAFDAVIKYLEAITVLNAKRKYSGMRTFKKKHMLYSYFSHCPYFGSQFIVVSVFDPNDAGDDAVHKERSFVHIPFGPLYVKETAVTHTKEPGGLNLILPFNNGSASQEENLKHFQELSGNNPEISKETYEDDFVYMVLALSGRFDSFIRFINDYIKEVILKSNNVALSVVLYGSDKVTRENVGKIVSQTRKKFPQSVISVVQGPETNSKSKALHFGISFRSSNDLIFVIDVDMTFTSEVFDKIRWFTIQGKQVYYPIVFSEFHPALSRKAKVGTQYKHFEFNQNFGHWRRYGYGMVSIYKSDLDLVGGYDITIIGWGVEDVDLYRRVYKASFLNILRSPEPSLVHIYHKKNCDKRLTKTVSRNKECQNSLHSVFASEQSLLGVIESNPSIYAEGKAKQKSYGRRRRRPVRLSLRH